MSNYHGGRGMNFDSYLEGTGMKHTDVYFVVPQDVTIPDHDRLIFSKQWCLQLFRNSVFIGTEDSCKRNLDRFPGHKIAKP